VRRNPRVSVAGGTFHLYCRPARGEQPLVGNEATIDEMGYLVPMYSAIAEHVTRIPTERRVGLSGASTSRCASACRS
jgi:hypothetical protein